MTNESTWAFVASEHLCNLADRLAHQHGGISMHRVGGPVRCRRLVIVTDGHGLGPLRTALERVQSEERIVLGVGLSGEDLSWSFPGASWVAVPDESPLALWPLLQEALVMEPRPPTPQAVPTVFVSHAAQDEVMLFPVLTTLREHFGVPLFVCADSIPSGAAWKEEIIGHLERCDRFLYVASKAANQSVYCAFEVGMAMARGKPIRIVSCDGTSPPAFIQDIQAIDLHRLLARKPWLTSADGLLEACLDAIGDSD